MLTEVLISPHVLEVCWFHALSNEKQENMGLLIGQKSDTRVKFYTLKAIKRMTKERDRVEIDPNQLIGGSNFAAGLEDENKKKMCVLGWYHSHPHITVHPSHVDLRTQYNYQQMDHSFVGLIFSVFNRDPVTGQDTREMTAFQALEVGLEGEEGRSRLVEQGIRITVQPELSFVSELVWRSVFASMKEIPLILLEEERGELEKVVEEGGRDSITQIHNISLFTARLAHQFELVARPMLEDMEWKILKRRLQNDENNQPASTVVGVNGHV